ncbi:selenium-dependent molybdenum cofactor biosynthesis protein YqeB [Desulfobacula toluolica]|uniref:Selenium-dependent molybdenum hydroxylase system protein n=1 Tax=Desulfobacula toluolica (strain DSM 7467 / Tol2) TaxID=651182 RepID=K0NL70_DESTT|nr:selenium-dependent molybdenum cofactor biosynthesis protein YqeB [Desulfobacula toluolica]CCK82326.1 selenium-dependent molybdenum hydroxylase system protein [Desulfobacula toluolica Tol2]
MDRKLILMRGGGDLGSAVAHKLYRCGFRVVISEVENPLVVRRTVSYAQAVIEGESIVEGVKAVLVKTQDDIIPAISHGDIPVFIDPQLDIIERLKPYAVIDSTMSKKNRGMNIQMAPLTLALGPGFKAKEDVDAVIETKRGHFLGRIIYNGQAIANTGIPESVNGYGKERVLRAPCQGTVMHKREIGDFINKGCVICSVNNEPVKAPFDGMLRGLIMQGASVKKGLKIGDVDPRCKKEYCYSFSDKARAVAGGVLEAVLHHLHHARIPNQ